QLLLACTGPLLFDSPIDDKTGPDTRYYSLAGSDLTMQYFAFGWRIRNNDIFGRPLIKTVLAGLSRDVSDTSNTFLLLDDMRITLSMDDGPSQLSFSAKHDAVNQAFHNNTLQPGTGDGGKLADDTPPTEAWMELSGLKRFPGCVVLGLESGGLGDGGIKSLADMFSIVGLAPSPWLRTLLSETSVTLAVPDKHPARNAMWFLPGNEFMSCLRLEGIVDVKGSFGGFIGKYLSLWSVPSMQVIAKRTVTPIFNPTEKYFDTVGELTLGVELDIGAPKALGVYTSIKEELVTFMLVSYSPAVGWAALKDWLKKNCEDIMTSFAKLETDLASLSASRKQAGSAPDAASQQQPASDSNLSGIFWRKMSVTISDNGISAASIDLEASLPYLVPKGKHAVFDLSFSWEPGMYQFDCRFVGRAPQQAEEVKVPIQYHLDYERWAYLEPLVKSEDVMSLKYLSPGSELSIPYGIPSEIAAVGLTISNQGLKFNTQLQSSLPPPETAATDATKLPVLRIDRVFLTLDVDVDYSTPPTKVSIAFDGSVALHTRHRGDPTFYVLASIRYRSGDAKAWSFSATAANVPLAALYSLFAGGAEQSAAVNMLRAIQLKELSLGYEFNGAAASEVNFDAALSVAGLAATIEFRRFSATGWTLSAKLAPKQPDSGDGKMKLTLGGAVRDLLGQSVVDLLPELIRGTELPFSGDSQDKFVVICTRQNDPSRLVFGAELSFGAVRVHFAQVADVTERKPAKDDKGNKVKMPPPSVKRMIRVSLALPTIGKELPLIGKLDLPCDGIEFLWASSDTVADDLQTLNAKVDFLSQQPITMLDGDSILAKGLHFRLLDHGSVLIDHLFSNSDKTEKPKQPTPPGGGGSGKPAEGGKAADPGEESAGGDGEPATMAPMKRQKGGLKISGIGLSFDDGVLAIHLDARASLGPIEAGVKGLVVQFNLSNMKGLHDLYNCDIDAHIDGFDISFDRPPVMLAGALYHMKMIQTDVYSGGIAVAVPSLSIAALGQYVQVAARPPEPAYASFFVYAMLEGTLFSVGWADINGLIAGFGYNSKLRLPEGDQISSFPFLSGFSEPGGFSLEQALTSLTGEKGWITPSAGSLWLAAGLLMRACQTLDIRAVATLALGPDQGEVALLARATACLPRGSKPEGALMLIDLSIMGKLDFLHGEFSVQGSINPTSFILNKDCRPSGGFAIKSWFGKNKPHAGDWVVSFGGYHPAFRRPDHYPNPARLGISWSISSHLSVTGEAYAAVTPGAIMAGGMLHACFQLGGLSAWFDAHADFLVNLKPLYYEAEIAVSAGVSYEIRIWFIRAKISIELGASLILSGPPLGGTVHLDVAVLHFNIDFGDSQRGEPAALGFVEFLNLVLTEAASRDDVSPQDLYKKAHVLSVTSGRVSGNDNGKPKTKDEDRWLVRSNDFHFQVRSPVPIGSASVINDPSKTGGAMTGNTVRSRPMHMKPNDNRSITSTFSVTVRGASDAAEKPPLPFRIAEPVWDRVPSNHWGEYADSKDDYLDPGRSAATVSHLVGLSVLPPLPQAAAQSLSAAATAVAGETHTSAGFTPGPAPQDTVRYLGDEGRQEVRDSLRWERVQAAMAPEDASITRIDILAEFLGLVMPVTEKEKLADEQGGAWKPMGEKEKIRSEYRKIGALPPRVVLAEPRRFYRSPPMVFCS
ncbi:hypothetical protein B0T25DRAFT_599276, partial [Lasiosphaeria hispida]